MARTDTKTRLVDAAMRLFSQKGYQATTTSEVAREAGANAGSLYFFFPTKQQLLLAVLDRYHDSIGEMLLGPAWKDVSDPIERVFALLDFYRTLLVDTGCSYGCPIGNLALELHDPDPVVREKLAANFAAWTVAVEGCLREAADRLSAGVDPRQLATFVLTTMEGGVMQARTYRSLEAFDASVRALKDYFARLERPAAHGA